jgi:hypothetical protein
MNNIEIGSGAIYLGHMTSISGIGGSMRSRRIHRKDEVCASCPQHSHNAHISACLGTTKDLEIAFHIEAAIAGHAPSLSITDSKLNLVIPYHHPRLTEIIMHNTSVHYNHVHAWRWNNSTVHKLLALGDQKSSFAVLSIGQFDAFLKSDPASVIHNESGSIIASENIYFVSQIHYAASHVHDLLLPRFRPCDLHIESLPLQEAST